MTDHAVLFSIEQELSRAETNLANLRLKVHATLEQLSAVASSAPPTHPTLPVYLTTKGAFRPRGFWYRGTFRQCGACIDIYVGVLRTLAQHDDDAMRRTAEGLRRYGRTRTYLATSCEQLFRNQPADWAHAHSRRIAEGWYADTNLGLAAMRKLMRRILKLNGLVEGTDIVILWNRSPIDMAAAPGAGGLASDPALDS